MGIFASQTQVTLPVPFDEGQTVSIRKLTGREVELAQAAHAAGVATGRSRLWAQRFRQMLQDKQAPDAEVQAAINDPLTGYDRFEVVKAGLVAWSYRPIITNKDTLRDQAIDDLDDEAVEWIAREILRLTKPALFDDPETARKNG